MLRKLTLLPPIASLAIVSISLCSLGWAQQPPVSITLLDVKGVKHSVSEYRGQVVVLNFWASWCVPCRHEMPVLTAVQKSYSASGLVVLGASLDELPNRKEVETVAKQYRINFPIFLNVSEEDMTNLGLESVPATVLLDRRGRVMGRLQGELDETDLNRRIKAVLGTQPNSHR